MTFARAVMQEAATGVAIVDRPEDLGAFLRPDCAAAIWRRQPWPAFQTWIETLDPSLLPQGRNIVAPDMVTSEVTSLCKAAQTPTCPERDHLISDISALANHFSGLLNATYLRVRLQAVTTNACRKFHVDAIKARLVCTYRGPGTQYGISRDVSDPKRVFSVATGAPILLRGTLWPERPSAGLRHRSPPIEGTGGTRLVLVLDALDTPEDDI